MAELPSGTITFLFTDIEGSTRLIQELPEHYEALFAAHDELVRRAIEQAGGTEVRTEGDSFFVVFTSASDAVHAAWVNTIPMVIHRCTILWSVWPRSGR